MYGSWRNSWISVLTAGLVLLPGPALPLEVAELAEIETLLRGLGFDPGPVDGVVDDETIEAIRRYQEFAALPGEPEPSAILLGELRGVAAAFAALSTSTEETASPATAPVEAGEDQGAAEETEESEEDVPAAVTDKVVVPAPPAPPKLKPAVPPVPQPEPEVEAEAEKERQEQVAAEPQQTAELPPAQARKPRSRKPRAQRRRLGRHRQERRAGKRTFHCPPSGPILPPPSKPGSIRRLRPSASC